MSRSYSRVQYSGSQFGARRARVSEGCALGPRHAAPMRSLARTAANARSEAGGVLIGGWRRFRLRRRRRRRLIPRLAHVQKRPDGVGRDGPAEQPALRLGATELLQLVANL